jgi:DNA-binding SARP family transcriptional activator
MSLKSDNIVLEIKNLLAANCQESAADKLIEHSRDLLQPGRLVVLKKILASIPREYFLSHPKLILISANADYQSGELKSALRSLTVAVPLFKNKKDRSSLSATYRYLSYIHQDMGQNKKAIYDCQQGLKYLHKDDYRGQAGLLAAMAGSHWRLLDNKKALGTYGQVMDIYIRAGDKEGQIRTLANSSAIFMILGELEKARKEKEEVLRFYRDSENRRSYCLAAVNLSSLYLEMFESDRAELLLTSAIPEIQKIGLGMALGPARVYLGECQIYQNRFPEAEKTLKFALDNSDSSDEASYHSLCLIALSTLYRLKGNHSLSMKYACKAIEKISKERPLDTIRAEYNLSRVYLAKKDLKVALKYAIRSVNFYARTGISYKYCLALLNLAEIYMAKKKTLQFRQTFFNALKICRRFEYDFLFDGQHPDNFRHLLFVQHNVKGISKYLRNLTEKYGAEIDFPNKNPRPFFMQIKALGPMSLSIDGKMVMHWKRKASRQVLGILLSRHISSSEDQRSTRDQYVPAETLSLMLWPQKSLASASLNLQVAVAELRRVFEPELKDGKNSRYVEFLDGNYRLNDKDMLVDFNEFVLNIRKAKQAEITGQQSAASEFYRQAVEMYHGDFLIELKLVELEGPRERLRQQYFQALLSLAGLSLKRNCFEDAIKYASIALSRERCLEEAHRILMTAYHRTGRKELIIKQFYNCRTALRRDLGLDISPETLALYRMLSG